MSLVGGEDEERFSEEHERFSREPERFSREPDLLACACADFAEAEASFGKLARYAASCSRSSDTL
jgi:hypothetical protein